MIFLKKKFFSIQSGYKLDGPEPQTQREVVMDLRVAITFTSRAGEEVGLGPGVTEIPDEMFVGRTDIASVTLPVGITKIGGETFQFCTSLAAITIPEGVTTIGEGAFSGLHLARRDHHPGGG